MTGPGEGDKQLKVPPPPNTIAKALADLTQQMVSLFACLEALESWPPVITTFHRRAAKVTLWLVGLWDNTHLHDRFRCRSILTSIASASPCHPCRPAICYSSCFAGDEKMKEIACKMSNR